MKKQSLKSLALNKKSISSLVGGLVGVPVNPSGPVPVDDQPGTMYIPCHTGTLVHTDCWCNIERR
jgi:hypothetical protein